MWSADNIIMLVGVILIFAYHVLAKVIDSVLRYGEIKAFTTLSQHPVIIARENYEEEDDDEDPDIIRDQINNMDI